MSRPEVEFRILGPLEVRVDGRTVGIGPPKQRVLLARLVLDPGQTVSTVALAEAIWGDRLPESPRRALQLNVTRLRAALVDAGSIIRTWPDGYSIEVPPEQVDLGRFTAWLQEAARAAERDDVEKEAAALAEALAQWRGDPLADVPSSLLARETVPGLREQRLRALERRIDADLRCGRHAELVSELRQLVAQHPLRERLWELLLRALDAAGRRADALDAYHELRRRLADELGIEPGEDLRGLHAAILAGRSDAGRRTDAGRPVPRQLPPDLPGFVGRAEVMARLDALAAEPAQPVRVVVIAGTAGVGKTALAVRWARRVADRFPDGQLWVNLRGHDPGRAVSTADALTRFLHALGVPGAEVPLAVADQAALFRAMTDRRRMLIVVDNARSADQVRPLLPGAGGSLVVVGSRSRLTDLVGADDAHAITLDLFTVDEAGQLLARRLGGERLAAEPEAVDKIIHRCARLPLALAIAAARAAVRPGFGLDALAAELDHAGGDLDLFTTDEPGTDMRTVFSWSYRALSPDAARLFRLLGLHPGPELGVFAAASLAGVPVQRARAWLRELVRAHLVAETRTGRYALHDLLLAYAAELAHSTEEDEDRRESVRRMLDTYLHTAAPAARLVYPVREPITLDPARPGVSHERLNDHDQAMDWFGTEQAVLLGMVERASTTGFDLHTWRLAWALTTVLDRRGHWHDVVTTQRMALDAARRLGDLGMQATSHRYLANAYTSLGAYDAADAHLRQALHLFEATGDVAGRGHAQSSLAYLRELQHRFADALHHAGEALHAYQEAGHRPALGFALNQLGWYYAKLGNAEPALAHCQRALAIQQEVGDEYAQACTWDSLGYAYHRAEDYRQAVTCYQHALDRYRALGSLRNAADTLHRVGDTHHATGDLDAARVAWEQALRLLARFGHPDADLVHRKLRAS
jgi:DNA-binding SARP family transcriptional activator/Tfp pilus assembly protein PilF